jgi:hypothetical protein
MRAAMSEDCAGLPPGRVDGQRHGHRLALLEGAFDGGRDGLIAQPGARGLAMMAPCRRTTATSGSDFMKG